MKKRTFLTGLIATILAVAVSAAGGAAFIQLYQDQYPTQLPDGNWEYIYDVFADETNINKVSLSNFDISLIVNQFPYYNSRTLYQKWDFAAANNAYTPLDYGSYSVDGVNWLLPDRPWAIHNAWHDPIEYQGSWGLGGPAPFFSYGGELVADYWVEFPAMNATFVSGLVLTFRIVHPYMPDYINWGVHSFYGDSSGTVLGPGPAPPEHPDGDVDRDFDVDVDDIDALCDFLRGEDPVTGFRYDLSDDGENPNEGGGVVDMNDLDFLVHYRVETTVDNGTEYGDFNLDGVVDTTDLTRMATNYGADDWGWDDGNANGYIDTDIDNTDLTILATYYGFGEPDIVPEPASAGLLLLGASAVLRRRRKAKR